MKNCESKAGFAARLIGSPDVFTLRHRVFNVILLVGIFMSFSAAIMNFVIGLPPVTVVITAACGIATTAIYFYSFSRVRYDTPALLTVLMLSVVFFPTMWLINAGSGGSIPYYFVFNTGIIALLLTGVRRIVVLALFIGVTWVLFLVEYHLPHMVLPYDSLQARYADLAFGLSVVLVANGLLLASLVDSYVRERERAEEYLLTLRARNDEIQEKNRRLQAEERRLRELAITDELTGSYNRLFLTEYLERAVERSRGNERSLAVVLVDVDDFKQLNDTYGHAFGDIVLARVGNAIGEGLRRDDVLARFGGDEFVIVLPDTDPEQALKIMERVRRKIAALAWEHEISVTISAGIAELVEDVGDSDRLLERADERLYLAKHSGKDCVVRHDREGEAL